MDTLSLAPPSDLRMLTTLLASCDPAGHIAAGASPDVYRASAALTLQALHAGEETVMVMLTLPADTPVDIALRYARAAQNWWDDRLAADDRVLATAA